MRHLLILLPTLLLALTVLLTYREQPQESLLALNRGQERQQLRHEIEVARARLDELEARHHRSFPRGL